MSSHGSMLGRTVLFKLSATDAAKANEAHTLSGVRCLGNEHHAGDVVPMVIVREWSPGMVNGQVLLDGHGSLWVTSVHEGLELGQWHEMGV